MPPSQCVNIRQKRMDRGNKPISLITVAPVVVNPETDSKTALGTLDIQSLNKYYV